MNNPSDFWNNRYSNNESVYGYTANVFFKQFIDKHKAGTLLLPCEGEGRNAIYAAASGWHVTAFDFSEIAVAKALQRAGKLGLTIQYTQNSLENYIPTQSYDLIASIYVHMEAELRKSFHKKLIESLKPGGSIIMEAFNKNQINYQSGGPGDTKRMYSIEELASDFSSLSISLLEETITELTEGDFHKGKAAVIQLIASS